MIIPTNEEELLPTISTGCGSDGAEVFIDPPIPISIPFIPQSVNNHVEITD